MISDLDTVIDAMVNRDRQAADDLRAKKMMAEWQTPPTPPVPPRPKGARVKFTPSPISATNQ